MLIAQAIGFIGLVIMIGAWQTKKRTSILLCMLIGSVL